MSKQIDIIESLKLNKVNEFKAGETIPSDIKTALLAAKQENGDNDDYIKITELLLKTLNKADCKVRNYQFLKDKKTHMLDIDYVGALKKIYKHTVERYRKIYFSLFRIYRQS